MIKFEDLETWQSARTLTKKVYDFTRTPELVRDFGITGQIQRAKVSIMSNVAEGFERVNLQEKLQFYNVARSSTAEVRSLTYVIQDNFSACAATTISLRDREVQTGKLVSGLIRSTERCRPGKALSWLLALMPIC